MAEHDENVEIMDEDEIVTLYDDNGEPIDFYEVACVEYDGAFYALLEPVEEMEGVEEGEVFILRSKSRRTRTKRTSSFRSRTRRLWTRCSRSTSELPKPRAAVATIASITTIATTTIATANNRGLT